MHKKKQIVFVNQSSGYLMIDILEAFDDIYEERILITGYLNPREKNLGQKVILKKMIPYDRSSSFKRLMTWSMGFLKAVWLIKTRYRDADLFLVTNPPFTTFIPLLCSNKYKLLIYDIYPDALVEFSYFKKESKVTKVWEKVNRKVFKKAQKVYTLTEGMKSRILNYTSEENIKVVPIWTENEFLKPIEKSVNPFIIERKLEDKFIVMYSGNLGKSHPVEIMVELAKLCKNPKIHFMIIGGGDKYNLLDQKITDANLSNITLQTWMPTQEIPQSMNAADIGVVTLGKEATDISIPSKTFNLFSVAKPILAICNKEAALADLIKRNKCGESFPPDEIQNILDFINRLHSEKELHKYYASNSLKTSLLFTKENAKSFL
ncbi:glycosyltransferase family 4 protein [Polaribacter litorisediminis]|uniref:glycosyltransferase family 4 protein n=1 Tax=Polaribacter litorisediminis TaxID=1908341 RepID=UPI001CBE896B|nr:glycosyltransferase family 4 protein [Polaribacter litorisediminis]UAM96591.1 glycosyltransferase family 4 protein [Polaribacter litorisediminis]